MKSYLNIIVLSSLGLLILFTCSKNVMEDVPPSDEFCVEIPDCIDDGGITTDAWGWNWETEKLTGVIPCFNPNNSDEIMFRTWVIGDDKPNKLIKYNLITKTKEEIFAHTIRPHRFRWSKKDWLLFQLDVNHQFNIYKIKSNGDSLTQLTFSGNCHAPEWNITGDKFIYKLGGTSSYIIADENGSIIDTTFYGIGYRGSWQHDSLAASVNLKGLYITNPYRLEQLGGVLYIDAIGESTWSGGAEWIDNENVIWAHGTGVYRTNIITQETIRIIESCNARLYTFLTYSPFSKKLIYQRFDREVINVALCQGKQKVRLFMMNPDGTDEQEIIIPE